MASQGLDRPGSESLEASGIGYRERGLWVSLLAVALVDTLYFAFVVYAWGVSEPISADGLIGLLLLISLLLLAIALTFTWVTRAAKEPMDERDQAIAAASARQGYLVLVGAVVMGLALHLFNVNQAPDPLLGFALFDVPLIEVHFLLAGLVSAELVRYGAALLRYRQG